MVDADVWQTQLTVKLGSLQACSFTHKAWLGIVSMPPGAAHHKPRLLNPSAVPVPLLVLTMPLPLVRPPPSVSCPSVSSCCAAAAAAAPFFFLPGLLRSGTAGGLSLLPTTKSSQSVTCHGVAVLQQNTIFSALVAGTFACLSQVECQVGLSVAS